MHPPSIHELPDTELMTEIAAGATDAFGELYDRYCDRAFRLAMAVCGDAGRAEDAVQEAFLSLWRSRTGFDICRGSVASWVLCAVRRRAIDVLRRDARHRVRWAAEEELASEPATGDMVETAIERVDADRVRVPLAALPEGQLEVIALAYYGELSHTEIAARLQLPAGTVKGRMRLGLEKLRDRIDPHVA